MGKSPIHQETITAGVKNFSPGFQLRLFVEEILKQIAMKAIFHLIPWLILATFASGQQQTKLKIFLDCQNGNCDFDYARQQIILVDFVHKL